MAVAAEGNAVLRGGISGFCAFEARAVDVVNLQRDVRAAVRDLAGVAIPR